MTESGLENSMWQPTPYVPQRGYVVPGLDRGLVTEPLPGH